MTLSKAVFYLCISFVSGILAGSLTFAFQIIALVLIVFCLIAVFAFLEYKKAAFFGFCLFFVALGIFRASTAQSGAEYIRGSAAFEAVVVSEPQKTEKSLRLTLGKIEGINGKVLVTTGRYPEYRFNDVLKVSGMLEAPEMIDGFNYQKYLEKDKIFSIMSFPKIELVGYKSSGVYEKVLVLKDKLKEGIQKNFSPPYSSVLEGMVLGDNNAMSDDLKNKLNITGLRHIIAISGTHIVILSSILMSLFIAIGLWRGQAFYLSLFLIIFYIILSGSPASGVRAGIMGGIFMYGKKIGRKSASGRTIAIAGAIMLLLNPMLLLYDVGFQLSFLACLGMIYMSPIFEKYLKLIFKDKLTNLKDMVSATLSAQAFTFPIIVYSFGNVSFISIVTNILILPVVYPLMVFGFISSFFGFAFDLVSWVFVLPTWFFLWYFISIIDLFSIPFLSLQVGSVHWLWLAFFYAALLFALKKKAPAGSFQMS